MTRDRNLLFGILAVQLKFITPQQLVEAAGQWAANPERDIGDILVSIGNLSEKRQKMVEDLILEEMAVHGGDISRSLQAFGGERAVHETFAGSIIVEKNGSVSLASFGGSAKPAADAQEKIEDAETLTIEHPGRYTIKGEQGRGGIGRVLIAFDEHVGREIALKELLPDTSSKGTPPATPESPASPMRRTGLAVARFLREARVTGQLEHPGIVPVYEVGKRSDSSLYYTMKLVRGKTLANKIKEARTLPERLKLLPHFLDLCQTAAYAHSRGVIHRDIKPHNVMIGEFGETVVLDWGLAKVKGMKDEKAREIKKEIEYLKKAEEGQTARGKPIGTPAYMSPEQADGRIDEIDETSDVWNLGAVLYEILSGRPPYDGDTIYEIIGKVLREKPSPLLQVQKDAPPELAAMTGNCLNHDKKARYQSAELLASDMRNYLSGGLVSVYEYSSALLMKRWLKKRWPLVLTVCIAFAVFAVQGVFSFMKIQKEKEEAISNLADTYLLRGAIAESRMEWGKAQSYFATAVSLSDEDESRYSLNYSMTRPEVKANLIHVLEGHNDAVIGAVFSPDGKTVASLGEDRIMIIWDSLSGKLLHKTGNETSGILTFAYSPDGKYFATAGNDKKVNIWNVISGKLIKSLEGMDDYIKVVAFSPQGDLLAAGGKDKIVRVWDVETGNLKWSLSGHTESINCVKFSPDGKTLASGGADKFVLLWSISEGIQLQKLDGHTEAIFSFDFSPDGEYLAWAGWDNTAKLWKVSSGQLLNSYAGIGSMVSGIDFSPDGKILAVSGLENIHLIETNSFKLLNSLKGHSAFVWSLQFSPDGKMIASAGADNSVKLWNADDGRLLASIESHTDTVWSAAFSPDGKRLLTAGRDRMVKLWDIGPNMLVKRFNGQLAPVKAGISSPDGAHFVTGGSDGAARLWDIKSGQQIKSLGGHSGMVNALAYSPDGNLLATGDSKGVIKIWNASSGDLIKTLEGHTDWAWAIAFSPDSRFLASGGWDNKIILWNTDSWEKKYTLEGHEAPIYSISFNHDGSVLASGGNDETVVLWEVKTGNKMGVLKGHKGTVTRLAFSPDGNILASASMDGAVKLWSLSAKTLIHSLEGHKASVWQILFTADGGKIITGGNDNLVRIWKVSTGEILNNLNGQGGPILSLSLNESANLLASGDSNGAICLWRLSDGKLLHIFRRHTGGVNSLFFTRDGGIISGGEDGALLLWPFISEFMRGSPAMIMEKVKINTGLKFIGPRLHPWNPDSGIVGETPLLEH